MPFPSDTYPAIVVQSRLFCPSIPSLTEVIGNCQEGARNLWDAWASLRPFWTVISRVPCAILLSEGRIVWPIASCRLLSYRDVLNVDDCDLEWEYCAKLNQNQLQLPGIGEDSRAVAPIQQFLHLTTIFSSTNYFFNWLIRDFLWIGCTTSWILLIPIQRRSTLKKYCTYWTRISGQLRQLQQSLMCSERME